MKVNELIVQECDATVDTMKTYGVVNKKILRQIKIFVYL